MDKLTNKLQLIEEGLKSFISKNKDIKALLSIGSYSQGAFDSFSDMDLFVFTDKPADYMSWDDATWAEPLGKIISRRVFRDRGDGVDKNKLVTETGIMYDLTFVPMNHLRVIRFYLGLKRRNLQFLLPGFLKNGIGTAVARFYDTIKRGCHIHHDTIGLGKIVPYLRAAYSQQSPVFPDKKAFANSYNNFWQSCYTASVKLTKGEYYHNLLLYDNYMKHQLLRAMEWLAITDDPSVDVFFNGARLQQWGPHDVYERILPTLFHDDVLEMQYCLLRSAALYQELSAALAQAYGFALNKQFEAFVINFIEHTAIPYTRRRLSKV
ncbi:aminoglycoside 6-adenylyltransferase [Chitinophaga rhizophila]|uniref:Aminoglycoside 6-adenylyltransferase n=1 Tax=Chitinophaga rhizophila TaxID=2866212 RepID=A0ABS7G6W1_9BACT|nr:aminoglycoside 6-adenylyltransferase [Chitinophaga rhizophila]MBW8683025.1 aminoglycoside 6-adenylyltransferase [Chitinophaga rhizophila]